MHRPAPGHFSAGLRQTHVPALRQTGEARRNTIGAWCDGARVIGGGHGPIGAARHGPMALGVMGTHNKIGARPVMSHARHPLT